MDISKLGQYNPELVSEELKAEDVVNTDSNVIATNASSTNIKILESANSEEEKEIDQDDGIEIFDESIIKPNSIEARNALETFQGLVSSPKKGNNMRDLLQRFDSMYVLGVTNA